MTQIDFYLLSDNHPDTLLMSVCKLCAKITKQQMRVYIQTFDQQQAEQLNQRLWGYQKTAFIPSYIVDHKVVDSKTGTENEQVNNQGITDLATNVELVAMGAGLAPDDFHQVLINLTAKIPANFSHFERLLELVPADHQARVASREAFSYYRDRGYKINTHEL